MHNNEQIKRLLVQLLSAHSPELGARLKQRLNSACIQSGLGPFDERTFGHVKFSEFLKGSCSDIISVELPQKAGDIVVRLHSSPSVSKLRQESASLGIAPRIPRVRNEVWQAFTNPDGSRRRFLNRETGEILHFREEDSPSQKAEIEAAPDKFAEIKPIPGEAQRSWMAEYLHTIPASPKEKTVLNALLSEEYSSQLNTTFSHALGEHRQAWRKFRTNKVVSRICEWAKENQVTLPLLQAPPAEAPTDLRGTTDRSVTASARQQAVKLLELISDDDIARLVLPTLLSTILIRSR